MNAFDKIIGYSSIKKELETLVDMMTNAGKYQKLGVKMPRGLLLYGDPGVGKTLMANCLIEASGRPCFTVRKDKADGDFINEIKNTFNKAKEAAPSIVFLDDMDKFSDTEGRNRNEEEYVTVQACMDDVKECDVFVIATANEDRSLPDSLVREGRLGRKVSVGNPQGQDAVEIIRHFLAGKEFVEEVNAEDVAKMIGGSSCAVLESCINEAGIYAGIQGKDKIDTEDLKRGVLRILFSAPESLDDIPEDVIKSIAYHEAGHAVISEIGAPGSVGLVSVYQHDGPTRGITSYTADDRYWDDKANLENRVRTLLGGKAATELVYGKSDIGTSSDLSRAFRIVARFVDDYCCVSFDSYNTHENSDALVARKDNRIAHEMDRYYAEAKRIIAENRPFLDAVANALVEKKILVSSEIQEIKKSVAAA